MNLRRYVRMALFALALPMAAVEGDDPVITAAQKALAAGQPLAALQVLREHTQQDQRGLVRLIQARAWVVLGRYQESQQCLGIQTMEHLKAWPERLRGAVAAVMGDIVLASGDSAAARPWLEQALRAPSDGMEIDRTLVLLAECCESIGDHAVAQRYAHMVWRDWSRSPYRARAGLLEASLCADTKPDQARALLAGVRSLDAVEPGTRMVAAELLCRLLLVSKPGQALVVAEQEMRRLPLVGRLPLYRALALVALDPLEGQSAIEQLDPTLINDPAAQSALLRVRSLPSLSALSAHSAPQDLALRIERARVEWELGRPQQARAMLEPLAATEPAALILLAAMSDVPLDAWLAAPAMADVNARVAVAIALSRRGDHVRAWPIFLPLIAQQSPSIYTVSHASIWYWAAQSAQQRAPEQVANLVGRILALTDIGVETGITWANEAQQRERARAPSTSVREAWERAALALPPEHPWQALATVNAVRPLLETGQELEKAMRLLEQVSGLAMTADQQRCRFLLAQTYERLNHPAQALQVVGELRQHANADQLEKLDRMAIRLGQATTTSPLSPSTSPPTSEALRRALDAEN